MASSQPLTRGLIDRAEVHEALALSPLGEEAWIEVIQKMDAVYADLVRHQIELEEKNAALEEAHERLNRTYSELKEAQHRLVHSEKMASLGRLVAGVAHELNNPVSVVYGNMHALRRYADRIGRYLKATERSSCACELSDLRDELRIARVLKDLGPLIEGTLEGAERMSEIVQDLRRYSASQREPAAPFDLSEVARTAVDWVIKAAREKPRVDLDLPESLVIQGRKGGVHQILVNLVQNALDVMEGTPSPCLTLCGGVEGTHAWITVRDTGPGIPAQDLARIFDPFFTTKPVGKGTGLGLYISYGLAEDMGGELSATNHPEGGAEFRLKLPVVVEG